MRLFPTFLFLCLLAPVVGSLSATTAAEERGQLPENGKEWDELAFKINDSSFYIGIAVVRLSVSELRAVDGNLLGEYTIRVPMMRSKNDHGRIVLPLDATTVAELAENGGVLRGRAYSSVQDQDAPNGIVCEIHPHDNQGIVLAITTDDRVLDFKSNYKVIARE